MWRRYYHPMSSGHQTSDARWTKARSTAFLSPPTSGNEGTVALAITACSGYRWPVPTAGCAFAKTHVKSLKSDIKHKGHTGATVITISSCDQL